MFVGMQLDVVLPITSTNQNDNNNDNSNRGGKLTVLYVQEITWRP